MLNFRECIEMIISLKMSVPRKYDKEKSMPTNRELIDKLWGMFHEKLDIQARYQ